ncbi:MAG TPA: PIN domain-containing protein [Dehalococcoidia bacterium]|nr:PIN domain-containing protein [Dehalococcoidia bacterium]
MERHGLTLDDLAKAVGAEPIALATTTVTELLVGVHRADTPERRARREAFVEGVLSVVPVFPFDLRAARVHAQLWAELLRMGQPIGAHDLIIGAIALSRGHGVLTQNLRDFARIPGLVLSRPNW